MNAFFSATDLADEMGTRFFGVIGKIDNDLPQMVVRAATNGVGIELTPKDIFDFAVQGSDYKIPEEHYSRIVEFKWQSKTGHTNAYASNGVYDYYDDYLPSAKTTTTARNTTGASSPYTKLYNLISTIRYGKQFKKESVITFLETAVECAARYVEDLDAPELDIHTVAEEAVANVALRFNTAIDAIYGYTYEYDQKDESQLTNEATFTAHKEI